MDRFLSHQKKGGNYDFLRSHICIDRPGNIVLHYSLIFAAEASGSRTRREATVVRRGCRPPTAGTVELAGLDCHYSGLDLSFLPAPEIRGGCAKASPRAEAQPNLCAGCLLIGGHGRRRSKPIQAAARRPGLRRPRTLFAAAWRPLRTDEGRKAVPPGEQKCFLCDVRGKHVCPSPRGNERIKTLLFQPQT